MHHWQTCGARGEPERSGDPGAGRHRPERARQLADRGGQRDLPALPGLHRERGAGAAGVSPVPGHRSRDPTPRARASTTPSRSSSSSVVARGLQYRARLHALPTEERRGGERPGQRGATAAFRTPSTGTTRTVGSAETTRRTCSCSASPGTCPSTRARPASRSTSSTAGTSAGSFGTRAADRCRIDHEQRHGWLPLQRLEAAQPRRRRSRGGRGRLRPEHRQLLQPQRLDRPGSAHVRHCAELRRRRRAASRSSARTSTSPRASS